MGVVIVGGRRRQRHHATAREYGGAMLRAARENRAMVWLSLVLLAGMALGAVYARSAGYETLERLDFLFAGNFKSRTTQPFLMVFSASFASSFCFILACFLGGLSIWGAFFIPAVLAFRGFGLGLTSGYLYAAYGWKGVLYNLAVVLPGAFVCCLSILAASAEGIRFSRLVASGKTHAGGKSGIRSYILRFGAVLAIACAGALLDLLFSVCFGGLFSF